MQIPTSARSNSSLAAAVRFPIVSTAIIKHNDNHFLLPYAHPLYTAHKPTFLFGNYGCSDPRSIFLLC